MLLCKCRRAHYYWLLPLKVKAPIIEHIVAVSSLHHELRYKRVISICEVLIRLFPMSWMKLKITFSSRTEFYLLRSTSNLYPSFERLYTITRCRHNRVLGTKIVSTDFPPRGPTRSRCTLSINSHLYVALTNMLAGRLTHLPLTTYSTLVDSSTLSTY